MLGNITNSPPEELQTFGRSYHVVTVGRRVREVFPAGCTFDIVQWCPTKTNIFFFFFNAWALSSFIRISRCHLFISIVSTCLFICRVHGTEWRWTVWAHRDKRWTNKLCFRYLTQHSKRWRMNKYVAKDNQRYFNTGYSVRTVSDLHCTHKTYCVHLAARTIPLRKANNCSHFAVRMARICWNCELKETTFS